MDLGRHLEGLGHSRDTDQPRESTVWAKRTLREIWDVLIASLFGWICCFVYNGYGLEPKQANLEECPHELAFGMVYGVLLLASLLDVIEQRRRDKVKNEHAKPCAAYLLARYNGSLMQICHVVSFLPHLMMY